MKLPSRRKCTISFNAVHPISQHCSLESVLDWFASLAAQHGSFSLKLCRRSPLHYCGTYCGTRMNLGILEGFSRFNAVFCTSNNPRVPRPLSQASTHPSWYTFSHILEMEDQNYRSPYSAVLYRSILGSHERALYIGYPLTSSCTCALFS